MHAITLIFPHQLFEKHPSIAKGRPIFLIEDPLYFGTDSQYPIAFHKQKLVLHRSSMRAFADELKAEDFEVTIIPHTADYRDHFKDAPDEIHVADPHDYTLEKRLKKFCADQKITLNIDPTPAFITPPEFLQKHIADRKKPFMASFYQAQRKRLGILMEEDGEPTGGRWSFDEDNRKKLPKGFEPPKVPLAEKSDYVTEAIQYVEKHFPDNPGNTENFRYPVTRSEAKKWLKDFIAERFEEFGPYEDAISTDHAFINHSLLTPSLNIGLLTPQEIIDAVQKTRKEIPINSMEGFIRQVIGWREFMNGIYKHRGVEIRNKNVLDHTRKIPQSFYDGSTGIPAMDRVIKQLQDEAYCHHIERLMVLGNFMLLCRFHPDEVYRWFMEMFIDAYDWVMVPNVYGMSQFADGGTFTTKPYISGSNYILKMSNEKKGDWADIWNSLYWIFVADNIELFLKNPRSSMMARTWNKFADEKKEEHRTRAEKFFNTLDS